jgi:hypothetical protein
MRKLVCGVTLLIFLGYANVCSSMPWSLTGHDWRNTDISAKRLFVTGYIEGLADGVQRGYHATSGTIPGVDPFPKEVFNKAFNNSSSPFRENINVETITNKLDEFYNNPKNVQILIGFALQYVVRVLNGDPEQKLSPLLENLRKTKLR